MTQLKNRKQRDWVSQVLEDIKDLKLNVDMEEIKMMKKTKLKQILKNSTEEKALEELVKKKKKHSKVTHIKHTDKNAEVSKIKWIKDESRGGADNI